MAHNLVGSPARVISGAQVGADVADCHVGRDHVLFRAGHGAEREARLFSLASGQLIGKRPIEGNTSYAQCGRYFLSFEPDPAAMHVLAVDESAAWPLRTVATFDLPYRKTRQVLDSPHGLFVGLYADTQFAEGSVLWLAEDGDGGIREVATIGNPYPDKRDQFGEDLVIDGDFLYVLAPLDDTLAENIGTIYVYDVSNPAGAAAPVSTLSAWEAGAKRLLVRAPYLYVALRDSSIAVFDIADPRSIQPVTTLERGRSPLWWGGFGFVGGNVSFVDDRTRLVIVDSDPASGTFGGELASGPFGRDLETAPFRVTSGRDGLALALFGDGGRRFEELRLY